MDDERDGDQLKYEVHTQSAVFGEFSDKYCEFMREKADDFEALSLEMAVFYEQQKQTMDELIRKLDFCQDLKVAIQRHCPTWTFDIIPTGSTLTGLGMKNSDLDATIHIPKAAKVFTKNGILDKRKASLNILQIVRRICQNDERMKDRVKQNIQFVPAQIPILRMESSDGIEVDLGVIVEQFLSSLHNTFLTKHYVDFDNRFAPFCAIVKIWGEKSGVKNPKDGGFNSYAMVLLVTHFLQCGTSPPILPNLPQVFREQKFFALSDTVFPTVVDFTAKLPEALPRIAQNHSSVAELFMQFLHYFANFDFRKHYISISGACIRDRTTSEEPKVKAQRMKEVYIEDPFDEHNPGRTVRSLQEIRNIFRETLKKFDSKPTFPKLNDFFEKIEYEESLSEFIEQDLINEEGSEESQTFHDAMEEAEENHDEYESEEDEY
ncbi:unnamed protein product [Caenorhabditis angaria]|uniref:PAP-associated domain-containing protein n=1 Tax=Caenorhabditis angaria TaxID=860376 RepID=A0A9P1MVZ8_9PELO|nr:unnamed protein product [Caenorhabditis angaria]